MSITSNRERILKQIEDATLSAQRTANSVTMLAVSKAQKINHIEEAFNAGQKLFGESYLSEALPKKEALARLGIEWHFIGPIQSNKTKDIAANFSWVQSVDREKIARRLAEQRPDNLPPLNICAQINLFDEATKQGTSTNQVDDLLSFIASQPKLSLRGVMAIPPPQSNHQKQLDQFQKIAAVYQQLQNQFPTLDTLSMGMSADMEAAIRAGSTMVRVGTALFGKRPDNWKELIKG